MGSVLLIYVKVDFFTKLQIPLKILSRYICTILLKYFGIYTRPHRLLLFSEHARSTPGNTLRY